MTFTEQANAQRNSTLCCLSQELIFPKVTWLIRVPAGLVSAGAIGCYAGTGIHLPVELGNKNEGQPRPDGRRAAGPPPDGRYAVKPVPNALGPLPHFFGTHERMRHKHLRSHLRRNEPV